MSDKIKEMQEAKDKIIKEMLETRDEFPQMLSWNIEGDS